MTPDGCVFKTCLEDASDSVFDFKKRTPTRWVNRQAEGDTMWCHKFVECATKSHSVESKRRIATILKWRFRSFCWYDFVQKVSSTSCVSFAEDVDPWKNQRLNMWQCWEEAFSAVLPMPESEGKHLEDPLDEAHVPPWVWGHGHTNEEIQPSLKTRD